jgi:hypothetical protein
VRWAKVRALVLGGTVLGSAVLGGSLLAGAAGPALAATPGQQAGLVTEASPARPVILIGIPGLRWTDMSAAATPELWRLAGRGSVGSLVVTAAASRTCPADAWLTLNAGARAAVPHAAAGPCPALPQVNSASPGGPARIPAMPSLVRYNGQQFSYNPEWGLLSRAGAPSDRSVPSGGGAGSDRGLPSGAGSCAIGPGAALALASPAGRVSSYLPGPSGASRAYLSRCRLTVVDVGALPAGGTRPAAVHAADRAAGRIIAAAPAGAIIAVAGLGDGTAAHLQAIIVSGPGYRSGELASAATRQPGLTVITDLTPTVLGWRGATVPSTAVGSAIRSGSGGTLAGTVRGLVGQDTAAQVYRDTLAPFFLIYGFGEGVLFGLLTLVFWGRGEDRRRRRRAAYRTAGTLVIALPAGTFLASLVPWWQLAHPALWLYGMALAWAAAIGLVALAGPWRRDPLGPPGFVAAVTVAVVGLDVITGSRLQLGTPFGLSVIVGGRYYGIGNNGIATYGIAGITCAAWVGAAVLRHGSRRRAVAAAAAVALFTVIASGWPGFGAKVGGTIAMVPAFLLLLAALAGLRLTARRMSLIAVSGLVLVAGFALVNYFVPATGPSDIGAFVGHVLHGGSGGILQRKVGSNIGSLSENPWVLVIPVVIFAAGLMLVWPTRLGLRPLAAAYRELPLLRPMFTAIWLIGLLGWFANDSGITVAGAALPFALPLAIGIVSSVPVAPGDRAGGDAAPGPGTEEQGAAPGTRPAAGSPPSPSPAPDSARS